MASGEGTPGPVSYTHLDVYKRQTVERALQIFLKLGLVEVLDSGTFYMSNIELLIGQSSTEGVSREARRGTCGAGYFRPAVPAVFRRRGEARTSSLQ